MGGRSTRSLGIIAVEHSFTCPSCKQRYPIHTFGGMNGLTPIPCDTCAEVICVGPIEKFMSWPYRVLLRPPLAYIIPLLQFAGLIGNPYSERYFARLATHYSPCKCGGTFRHDAPNHCPKCLAALPIDEIKRQLNWTGAGRPLVYITQFREA